MTRKSLAAMMILACVAPAAAPPAARSEETPQSVHAKPDEKSPVKFSYQTRKIEGWTVHISDTLLARQKDATDNALKILEQHLVAIVRDVPAGPVAKIRGVQLWLSPEYRGVRPTAEYHPDEGWLRRTGRNPAMAKGVEFTDIKDFEAETRRMPCFVLHELAHAYHDQVLGFDQPEIIAAYKRAVESKSYDAVERTFGDPKRPNTIERAYAMTNEKEYFSESTEAYFGRNDFFPFTREELRKHDPKMCELLGRLWEIPAEAQGATP
ncbi:MAG TPA: hypothetical protein VG269_29290 [Tepidisphaeraceae bacterium]|jgi:hypothetical protein|nr:hypothetical protein [Tepidisphaeraceae bacterium]